MKTNRRGRPRQARPDRDYGTPELQQKKNQSCTEEVLDLYLQKGVILPPHHWCGIHLRWLYTIRYGVPGTRALDICQASGMEIRMDDVQWRASREQEYMQALAALRLVHSEEVIKDVCIFNIDVLISRRATRENYAAYSKMSRGFEELERLWC